MLDLHRYDITIYIYDNVWSVYPCICICEYSAESLLVCLCHSMFISTSIYHLYIIYISSIYHLYIIYISIHLKIVLKLLICLALGDL
jgi:hypothetical protein